MDPYMRPPSTKLRSRDPHQRTSKVVLLQGTQNRGLPTGYRFKGPLQGTPIGIAYRGPPRGDPS